VITRYEILRGLTVKNASRQLNHFELICKRDRILALTEAIAVIAADLWAGLQRRGQLIGDNDLLISATALHHGLAVATGNVAHFSRIPGLSIEDWTKP
jgi:predicted nucleic acid-binding protein